jgi:cytochrome c oxidase cbb3-type subunit III
LIRNWSSLSLCALLLLIVGASAQTPSSNARKPSTDAVSGKRAYSARCANCHGLDGRGGERGPNIATSPRAKRLSEKQLTNVITDGRPASGMPAFRLVGATEIQTLVAYVRFLQGNMKSAIIGNSQKGKDLFFGKADCGSCHMVAGQGGFLGSDLSSYGHGMDPAAIRKAISEPPSSSKRARLAIVTTTNNETLKGIIRNEDNFSLQIQGDDGTFHMLLKSELQSIDYQPLMETNHGGPLSQEELDNVVGFLQSVSSSAVPTGRVRKSE